MNHPWPWGLSTGRVSFRSYYNTSTNAVTPDPWIVTFKTPQYLLHIQVTALVFSLVDKAECLQAALRSRSMLKNGRNVRFGGNVLEPPAPRDPKPRCKQCCRANIAQSKRTKYMA